MANFRSVQTSFWTDAFIEQCTPEQKLFYIYLITNPATRQCGVYEITLRKIAFETGYHVETVEKLIKYFEDQGKIRYSIETNEMFLLNFIKNDPNKSPKVIACVNKELKTVKNKVLIPYLYGMQAVSQEEEEEEEEKEEYKHEEEEDAARFKKPEFDLILEFFTLKGYATEAIKFYNYYESKNWMVGKNKMSKWKAAASGWINRINDFKKDEKLSFTEAAKRW